MSDILKWILKGTSLLPKIHLKINGVKYGEKLILRGWPFIFRFPQAKIELGNNCSINSNFFSNLIGLYQRTIIIARGNGQIKIGNNVGISGTTIYAWDNIEIGDYTLIGANVKILDNDFHPLDPVARMNNDLTYVKTKPIKIGKNVFIGCNCILLKGAEIGDNCIIGAGSVVHGKFADNCVIAGNPAKVINLGTANIF